MFITINANSSFIEDLFSLLIKLEKEIVSKIGERLLSHNLGLYWSVARRDPSYYGSHNKDFLVSVATIKEGIALDLNQRYGEIQDSVSIVVSRCNLIFNCWEEEGWVCLGGKGPYSVEEITQIILRDLK
jgi:hypothetical protein